MHYTKQILPLDNDGNFIVAVHFPEHAVGGECTRESSHAYFGCGNASNPGALTDVTSLCCIERRPCRQSAKQLNEQSRLETELGRPEEASKYEYQAKKELESTLYVPRKVLASRNGCLLIGIDTEIQDFEDETEEFEEETEDPETEVAEYIQRYVEVATGKIKIDDWEVDPLRVKEKSSTQAISEDGAHVIRFYGDDPYRQVQVDYALLQEKVVTKFTSKDPILQFVFQDGHWVGVEEKHIYVFKKGRAAEISKHKMPKQVFEWSATPALYSNSLAFSGDEGLVSVVNRDDGRISNYYPHPGCAQEDFANVKLSDDGVWMASKVRNNGELVVTCLESGESWRVAELDDQVIIEYEEGDFRSESSIPAAFNFVGDKLLVSDSKEVTQVKEVNYLRPADDRVFRSLED